MKNKKKSLLSRIISSNIALFIFALFLSFVSWIVVSFISETNIKPNTIENVPITISLPDSQSDYTYFLSSKNTKSTIDQTGDQTVEKPMATVEVKGNAIVVGSLKPEDIKLTGSIEKVDSNTIVGKNTVTVSHNKSGTLANYEVESIDPKSFEVYVDKESTKEFTIINKMKVQFEDEENSDDKYVNTTLTKDTVSVVGPESIVNQIASVEIHGQIPENETLSVSLSYYDENGDKLADDDTAYLKPEFKTVDVTSVVLEKERVQLVVDIQNIPEGIKEKDNKETCVPDHVIVAGPKDQLKKLAAEKINLGTIDYSELEDIENKIVKNITLPEKYSKDCKIVPENKDEQAPTTSTVKIDLHNYSHKEISTNITYTDNDYYFVFLPSTAVTLKICGSDEELEKITSSDITIKPDFSDKLDDVEPGNTVSLQNIPLKITLSDDYTESWVSGKYTVEEVKVTKKFK